MYVMIEHLLFRMENYIAVNILQVKKSYLKKNLNSTYPNNYLVKPARQLDHECFSYASGCLSKNKIYIFKKLKCQETN